MITNLRNWLIRKLGGVPKEPCKHKWYVGIEHYPRFTQDYWACRRCQIWRVYQHGDPPEPLQTEICNLAHVHIMNGRLSSEG